jgi:autotransporter-associated beta strand protein
MLAAATIGAGASDAADIAIIGMNADTNKTFAFVALANVAPSTQIKFTDNGWTAAGAFRSNEGIITWTAPIGGVTAGTVVTIDTTSLTTSTASLGSVTDSGDVNFSASGDQILAYTGAEATPTFLFALNNEGAAVWQSDATNSNTSALPPGLTNGTNALALNEVDNAAYSGTTSGTAAQLRAAICNAANWTSNDTANVTFVTGFTITSSTITGAATASALTTTYGTPSTEQTFAIGGTLLTADITATAPTGFEVSSDGTSYGPTATFTQSGGTASGSLLIRLKADAPVSGSYNAQNIVLSSTGATAVNITTSASGNAVSPAALTITGLTGVSKNYNGNTAASFTGTPAYAGLVNGEVFAVTGTSIATFATPGAGTAKPITVAGFTAPNSNYTVTQPALTANIDPVALTVTANNVVKTFGAALTGGAGSNAFGAVGLISPETIGSVTIAYGTGAAADDPVAVYAGQVTASAATGGTFDAGNYTIGYVNGDLTVTNAPIISLTGSLTAVGTQYGTASATPTSFSVSGSALTGDLTVAPPAGFEVSTSIGSGYSSSLLLLQSAGTVGPLTVFVRLSATATVATYTGNITVSGDGATSRTIATVSSEVTAKPLTITGITGTDREYNGSTDASLTGTAALSGVLGADVANVILGGTPVAIFAAPGVGTDIAVAVTGYSISGSASGNYTLSQPTGLVADITQKALTVSGAAVTTKPYDGTNAAVITGTLNGIVAPDVVTLVGTGTFADVNVGAGIAVTSTSTLGGAAAGNYSLTQPTGLTGEITIASQTITFNALPSKGVADAPFALTATASSGLPVSYASSNTAVATVSGTTLTIVGAGSTIITASQAGSTNYTAAAPVDQAQVVTSGPTVLAAGDVAIIGYNSNGTPDAFALLILRELSAGTVFFVNDNEVGTADGTAFTDLSEMEASFTVKAGQSIPAGTVVILPWGSNTPLSTTTYDWSATPSAGLNNGPVDSLYVYTASAITATTPTAFIFGANLGGTGVFRPAGLVDGNTWLTFSTLNPASRYKTTGATYSGTPASLVAAIGNTAANWEAVAPGVAGDWTFTVGTPQAQTITFGSLAAVNFGAAPFALTAAASSALPVSYASSNPLVATVSGSTVTIVGAGTTTITASQAGNGSFAAAPNVDQLLTVNPASQTISGLAATDTKIYGDASYPLAATATSGLAVTYGSSNTAVATISGNTVTIVGAGSTTITASQAGNANYIAATNLTQDLTVSPKNLSITANNVLKAEGATLTGGPGSAAFSATGLVSPDVIDSVTISYGAAAAAPASVGVYPGEVTPSAAIGASFIAGNYNIIYVSGAITVSNTPTIELNGALIAVGTEYGTASPIPASFSVTGSILGGDLTVTPPAGFEISTAVGSGYASSLVLPRSSGSVGPVTVFVRLSATTPVGAYSGNVSVSGGGATAQAIPTVASSVTAKALTITDLSAVDKEYDATNVAALTGTAALSGVIASDLANVTLDGAAVATFPGSAKGVDLAITVTGYTLSGSASGNYRLTQPTGLLADITAKALTITGAAVTTKPYDATAAAVITGTLTGVLGTEDVTLVGTGTFASITPAAGIAVTSTSTLGGTQSGNYTLTQPTGLTGEIIKAPQTITFAALPAKLTTDAPFTISATASSGLPVSFGSSNGSVATVLGNTVTIVGQGTTTIEATQAGDSNYEAASPVQRQQAVNLPGASVITITGNETYLQNFNTMGSAAPTALPTGWSAYRNASEARAPLIGTGTSGTGDVYNFGAASNAERALGTLSSTGNSHVVAASFVNQTGSTLEGANLQIGFFVEQWRQGTNAGTEVQQFEWKLGGTATDATGWNALTAFDAVEVQTAALANAAALDGNATANRAELPLTAFNTLSGWEVGQTLHIRWRDVDDTNTDSAMALDDFRLVISGVLPPSPKSYWDANGNAAGAGSAAPFGIWGTDSFWSPNLAGDAATAAWQSGSDAIFAAGSDAIGSYTVTVTGTQSLGGLFVEEGNLTLTGDALDFSDLSPAANVSAGATATISSVITGNSGLLKQGPGSLTLSGNNNFAGNINIAAGVLNVAAANGLGAAENDIVFGGGILGSSVDLTLPSTRAISGSGLLAPASGTTLTIAGPLNASGFGVADAGTVFVQTSAPVLGNLAFTAPGTLSSTDPLTINNISATHSTGTAQVTSPLNFGNTNRTVDVSNMGSSLSLSGALTLGGGGNNRLIKTGAGTLNLTGINTALNKVTVGLQAAVPTDGGVVSFSNKDALGATEVFFNYGTLLATTEMTGANAVTLGLSIGGRAASPVGFDGENLEFGGACTLFGTGTTGDISLNVNNHTTLSGALTGGYNVSTITALAIGGDGKLTLSGSASALTAPLKLGGLVTVELNTDLVGSATAATLVTHSLAADTTLAFGIASAPRLVTLHGGLTGAVGSALHFNIAGTARGTGHDALVLAPINSVAGAITFAGKILVEFAPGFTPANGQSFDVLDWDASITPDFTGIDFSELPALAGDLVWDTADFATSGILRIFSTIPRTQFPVDPRVLTVTESSGTVEIEVILTNPPNLAPGQFITVPFTVNAPPSPNNPATLNLDYTISATPLRFGPGETSKKITFIVKPDTLPPASGTSEAATEKFVIQLLTPVAPAGVVVLPGNSAETTFTVTINDDSRKASSLTNLAIQSNIVTVGSPVNVKVVPVGAAPLKLQWLKNGGTTLGAALTVTSGAEQTLSIANASLSSAGKYGVKLSNLLLPLGFAPSTVAELVVVERLAEFATPRLTLGKAASPLSLVANAAGTGLGYRWQLNGTNIPDMDTNYSGAGTKTLVIKSMATAREGVYQCVVTSTATGLAGKSQAATAYRVRQAALPLLDAAAPAVRDGVLPAATVGADYQAPNGFSVPFLPGAEGRQTPSSWKATGLPTGLSISAAGVISGNPDVEIAEVTTYRNIIISATNPAGTASATFTMVVNPLLGNSVGSYVATSTRSGSFIGNTGTLELGARIDFTTSLKGYLLTGKLTVGGTPYTFIKTRMNNNNPQFPTITLLVKRNAPLTNLTVTLTIEAPTNSVRGTITDGTTTSTIRGWRKTWNNTPVSLTKCATTVGSTTVVCVSTARLKQDMYVFGAGIPLGAKVASITNGTSFVLTAAATATTLKPTLALKADFGARGYTGFYNFGLDIPVGSPPSVPMGTGYGSFTVSTAGTLTIAGKTSDGQVITCASIVGPEGQVPFYNVLYATKQRGSLVGSLLIEDATAPDHTDNTVTGTVSWMRPADTAATARTYEAGFGPLNLDAAGSSYVAPVGTNLILGLTGPGRARLIFNEGGLSVRNNPSPIAPAPNVSLSVDLKNKLIVDAGTTTKFTLVTPTTGFFSGSFSLTDDTLRTIAPVGPLVVTRPSTFQGVMVREGNTYVGYGYFTLPKLPTNSPLTTTTTSDILSGQVVFEKIP